MTRHIPSRLILLSIFVSALGACGHSGGSGLVNDRATAHADAAEPRARANTAVYGKRVALSDAREAPAQTAPVGRSSNGGVGATKSVAEAGAMSARSGGESRANAVVVARGDTVLQIAQRNRVSVGSLMEANDLTSLTVEPGRRLIIPTR